MQHPTFGKVLLIDGDLQLTSLDQVACTASTAFGASVHCANNWVQRSYHEMISQVPLNARIGGTPARVLVAGCCCAHGAVSGR